MLRKSIVTAVVLSLLAVPFVFASGQVEEADDGTITLEMFHYLDLTNEVTTANWEELLAGFEASHPDINLEIEFLFDEAYHNKLQSMAVAGQLPDLMFLWPGKRTGDVTGAGLVKDISDRVAKVADEFAPAAVVAQGPNGEIYELPEQLTATHVMYTNTQLLDELGLETPETFEDLLAQGETIRAAGYIPIAMDNKAGWPMQSCLLSALVARTGGREWLDAARVGDASFTDPEFVDALEVINTLSEEDMFSPGINQADYGEALNAFSNGEAVYFIDGGWRTNELVKLMEDDVRAGVEYNVFPELPNERGIPGSTAIVAGTGFGMNAELTGAKADAAWEWIYYFAGPEGSAIKAKQGWLPAVKIPLPDDTPDLVNKLSNFVNNVPGGYVIDAVMDAEGMNVLHPAMQEMMFGNITPAEAAAQYENWVAANDSSRQ